MSERLIIEARSSGQQILTCEPCVRDFQHRPYIARPDALGLWFFCKACHAERLWPWAAIGSTLMTFCGPQIGTALLLSKETLAPK